MLQLKLKHPGNKFLSSYLNGAIQVTWVINGNSEATQAVGNYLLKEYSSGYTVAIGGKNSQFT